MEIDENLLGQVSDFLNTKEGAEILSGLKSSLGLGGKSKGEGGDFSSLLRGSAKQREEPKSPFENLDMTRLLPLVSAISSAKTDDRAANLLLALKPLLDPRKAPKIDHAISIMRIMALIPILEEHGFSISDIFS